ncbi:MAG: ATP synthase F0 subunit C [Lachnospiraceae bacterium]|nr:ATP synthase F0 subunit C [Lachnospiraceae bacterium]
MAFLAITSKADTADTVEATVTAAESSTDSSTGSKAIAAGIAIGLAALGGALGMGWAIQRAMEGISRQPEAEGKIRTTMMLGLVFIETAIIYALVVAILIIFVL